MTPFIQVIRVLFAIGAIVGLLVMGWNIVTRYADGAVVGAILFAAGALGFGIGTLLLRVHLALRR